MTVTTELDAFSRVQMARLAPLYAELDELVARLAERTAQLSGDSWDAFAASHIIDPYSPSRAAFHEVLTVRTGSLRYSLDFTEHQLHEGHWLWARPRQIHQYRSDLTAAEGVVILFQPGFLGAATAQAADADRPPPRGLLVPDFAAHDRLQRVLALLESEYRELAGLPLDVHIQVLGHLLATLVLHLAHLQGSQGGGQLGNDVFRRFRDAVERDYARSHRVEDYARELRYSARTLTRATRAATGSGAKRFIDDRVLLEAKRLLVHTDLSAAAIGERLGFPGSTVFTKFFRQRVGRTPTAFRASELGTWT
ncbi:helix-turn-helix domain-containing protein [Streptomyces sp. NPDC056683]|uniref:helix-turn-helix transcriptional regulator n=1 Tax=Streptomyces sp. NPDC056683 TaxID=3345910 RepID=UPI0036808A53